MVVATRLAENPILWRSEALGMNVNGPSLIEVPDWVPGRLGRYYLYFAHHLGSHIRLAYADALTGPWQVHTPGVLHLEDCPQFRGHIASPDVHVDQDARSIRLYFHGISGEEADDPTQTTSLATSTDGLTFTNQPALLGESYFRIWQWGGTYYALSLSGILWQSPGPGGPFARGVRLSGLPDTTRHLAVILRGATLWVAWTVIGDRPERIFVGAVDLAAGWTKWAVTNVQELLRPLFDWEGANAPRAASQPGEIFEHVNQLRDPAFFSDASGDYLIYTVAGESGLAIAEIDFERGP
ncbi:MAG: hypothetical protein AAF393_07550 [Pseudomonadota bacterium]